VSGDGDDDVENHQVGYLKTASIVFAGRGLDKTNPGRPRKKGNNKTSPWGAPGDEGPRLRSVIVLYLISTEVFEGKRKPRGGGEKEKGVDE